MPHGAQEKSCVLLGGLSGMPINKNWAQLYKGGIRNMISWTPCTSLDNLMKNLPSSAILRVLSAAQH
eukprot:scaffold216046_cov17-Tisochrysis_lutea.AAC.1